jgi:uncharacterized membrane protein
LGDCAVFVMTYVATPWQRTVRKIFGQKGLRSTRVGIARSGRRYASEFSRTGICS